MTEGTFDAYLWQTVENKQKFISQIMTSKSPVRSCDDVDETALSFAEIKAQYSLDCENGIENAVLLKPQTPEMVLEEKQFQEQVYAAVMKLPEKQAKRIYARYYLGMTVNEIAEVEGVDPSRVRDSIRRGLKQLVKYF